MKIIWFFLIVFFVPISIVISVKFNLYGITFAMIFVFSGWVIAVFVFRNLDIDTTIFIAILLLITAPIVSQNYFSKRAIEREFLLRGGDCLSSQSFFRSLTDSGNQHRYHAAMYSADKAYYWSYREYKFLEQHGFGSRGSIYAPDHSCYGHP